MLSCLQSSDVIKIDYVSHMNTVVFIVPAVLRQYYISTPQSECPVGKGIVTRGLQKHLCQNVSSEAIKICCSFAGAS